VNYPQAVRRRIGWMPDAYGTYDHMTVYEYLDFFGRAFGYRAAERADRIREVMAFTDLAGIADRDMKTLSKGMGQRLCLGRALLHDPEVLVLDEPAAGLDPRARVEFIRLVRLLAADGKTLFISSHILSELGEMCDTLLFIDQGRLVHHGSAESLTHHQEKGSLVSVTVCGDPERLQEWALVHPGVEWLGDGKDGGRLLFDPGDAEHLRDALRRMIGDGIEVVEFRRDRRRLEDAFVSILDRSQPPPLPGESNP
jgi:ABC-2 type transport system ATP-binding protein